MHNHNVKANCIHLESLFVVAVVAAVDAFVSLSPAVLGSCHGE